MTVSKLAMSASNEYVRLILSVDYLIVWVAAMFAADARIDLKDYNLRMLSTRVLGTDAKSTSKFHWHQLDPSSSPDVYSQVMYLRIDKEAARKRIFLISNQPKFLLPTVPEWHNDTAEEERQSIFIIWRAPHVLVLYLTATKYEMQPLMVDKPSLFILIVGNIWRSIVGMNAGWPKISVEMVWCAGR